MSFDDIVGNLDQYLEQANEEIKQLSQKCGTIAMSKKKVRKQQQKQTFEYVSRIQRENDSESEETLKDSSDSSFSDYQNQPYNQYDNDEKFKTSIKVRLMPRHTQIIRDLDAVLPGFSDSFLDSINAAQFGRAVIFKQSLFYKDQPFNRCTIFAKPNFILEGDIVLKYLRIQHENETAFRYLQQHRQSYKEFYKRCVLDIGSKFCVSVSYVKEGTEVVSVRYVLCEEKGLHYFEKHPTCVEIKSAPLSLVNNTLVERLMHSIDLKYQKPQFFQPSYKQILKRRRLRVPEIPNLPQRVEYEEKNNQEGKEYKNWINTVLTPLKIVKPMKQGG